MWKKFLLGALVIFACVGLVFTAVLVAMQFGWFNVRGASRERNQYFLDAKATTTSAEVQGFSDTAARHTGDPAVTCLDPTAEAVVPTCDWNKSAEWAVVRAGIAKDKLAIERVARETGVSSRIIASVVIPEQLRYFTADRERFKTLFEPLKALGSMSQFSLGVSGIKPATAKEIDAYLLDSSSVFYPGAELARLITYPEGSNHETVQFERISDVKNHYYAYLYAALYIREIQAQWGRAGYDISANPGVVTTLFNIGFKHSKPKATPGPGGSSITLGGTTYSFGTLGKAFYDSGELTAVFPLSS